MQLVPAGVSRSLHRSRQRLARWLEETPALFLGVVLTVALLFRLGIELVKDHH